MHEAVSASHNQRYPTYSSFWLSYSIVAVYPKTSTGRIIAVMFNPFRSNTSLTSLNLPRSFFCSWYFLEADVEVRRLSTDVLINTQRVVRKQLEVCLAAFGDVSSCPTIYRTYDSFRIPRTGSDLFLEMLLPSNMIRHYGNDFYHLRGLPLPAYDTNVVECV